MTDTQAGTQPDPEAERRLAAAGRENLAFQGAMAGEYRLFLEATMAYQSQQVAWLRERTVELAARCSELEAELEAYRLSDAIDREAARSADPGEGTPTP